MKKLDINIQNRLKEIIIDINIKYNNSQSFAESKKIPDNVLIDLFEDVVDKILYITSSPNFLFSESNEQNKNLNVFSYRISNKKNMNDIFNNNRNKIFILYYIFNSELMSNNMNSYILRGVFIDNREYLRDKKINSILDVE